MTRGVYRRPSLVAYRRRRRAPLGVAGSGAIAGTASGTGSATGTLSGTGDLAGTAAGTGAATGTARGDGALAGMSAGVGAASGSVIGRAPISGAAAGVGAATGAVTGSGALVGTAAGVGAATGTIVGAGVLAGTAAGVGAATGTAGGSGALAGTAAGVGTLTGNCEDASENTLLDGLLFAHQLDEASGDAIDASGNGWDLTDTNTVGAGTGKIDGGRVFVRSNTEYFTHAHDDVFNDGTSFSRVIWAKLTNKTQSQVLLSKWTGASANREYSLHYEQAADRFVFSAKDTDFDTWTATADTFGSPSTGTWYMLYVEYDATGKTVGISVNAGALDTASITKGISVAASDYRLGYDENHGAADVELDLHNGWGRVLTSSERTDLYNDGDGLAYPFTPASSITGTAAGTCSVTGTLRADGALAGTSGGTGAASGTLRGRVGIAGTAAGTATVTGSLEGTGALAVVAGGTCTATGSLAGTGALAGTAAGVGTATATFLVASIAELVRSVPRAGVRTVPRARVRTRSRAAVRTVRE